MAIDFTPSEQQKQLQLNAREFARAVHMPPMSLAASSRGKGVRAPPSAEEVPDA